MSSECESGFMSSAAVVSRLREALALADAMSGGGGPALVEPDDLRLAIQAMEDQSADQFPAKCWVLYDGGGSPLCSGGTVISFATRGVAEAWARERDICVRPVPVQLTHTEQGPFAQDKHRCARGSDVETIQFAASWIREQAKESRPHPAILADELDSISARLAGMTPEKPLRDLVRRWRGSAMLGADVDPVQAGAASASADMLECTLDHGRWPKPETAEEKSVSQGGEN